MLKKLRTYFLTGIAVTLPAAVTIYLTYVFLEAIDGWVRPLIPPQYHPETYLPIVIPGIGLIVVILALILIGALAANILGSKLVSIGEAIVRKVPVIRSIYGTVKQVTDAVVNNSHENFRDVVLVEYPSPGTWALAFITAKADKEIRKEISEDLVSVFLPTTPNPTSGYLLIVPRRKCIRLNMSVEEGFRYIISVGMTNPKDAEAPVPAPSPTPEAAPPHPAQKDKAGS